MTHSTLTLNLDSLTEAPTFWYVATPYTKHPHGLGAAFAEACTVTGRLVQAGVAAFSPIAHGHMIGQMASFDQTDHDFWTRVDRPFMDVASGILVVTMPGWQESRGVAEEVKYFEARGLPVVFLDPKTMEVTQ